MLGHPVIREHPNVVELEGICWDVQSEGKVWPVLVFQKTQPGDLESFMELPAGRDLSIKDRLKLCMDVGTAIMDMHSNRRSFKAQ